MSRLPLLVLLTAALTGGCGWMSDDKGLFVDKSDDYLDVAENEPLVIPGELDAERVADPYPIPDITDRLRPEYYPDRPPRPDAIYATDNRDQVRIQRLGERRWLVIPEPPTTVWPKVKQFLAENGVSLAWEAPRYGRLDTEWMNVEDESYRDVVRSVIQESTGDAAGGRDRLRIRVEPGLKERNTEIHLRYENSAFAPPGPEQLVDLQSTPSHTGEVEQKMLTELGAYVAARVAEQTVSMVAQDLGTGVKSYLDIDAGGDPVLAFNLDFDRAWATVGQALSRASIDVVEADEETGVYRISLPEDLNVGDDEPSWLGRLFSFGGPEMRDVRLRLEASGDDAYVLSPLDGEGEPLDREFGQQVLVLIREYAS